MPLPPLPALLLVPPLPPLPPPSLEHSDTDTWPNSAWLPSLRPALVRRPPPHSLAPPLPPLSPLFSPFSLIQTSIFVFPPHYPSLPSVILVAFSFFSLLSALFLSLLSLHLSHSSTLSHTHTLAHTSVPLFLLSLSFSFLSLLFSHSLTFSVSLWATQCLFSQPIGTESASTFYVTTLRKMIIS